MFIENLESRRLFAGGAHHATLPELPPPTLKTYAEDPVSRSAESLHGRQTSVAGRSPKPAYVPPPLNLPPPPRAKLEFVVLPKPELVGNSTHRTNLPPKVTISRST